MWCLGAPLWDPLWKPSSTSPSAAQSFRSATGIHLMLLFPSNIAMQMHSVVPQNVLQATLQLTPLLPSPSGVQLASISSFCFFATFSRRCTVLCTRCASACVVSSIAVETSASSNCTVCVGGWVVPQTCDCHSVLQSLPLQLMPMYMSRSSQLCHGMRWLSQAVIVCMCVRNVVIEEKLNSCDFAGLWFDRDVCCQLPGWTVPRP